MNPQIKTALFKGAIVEAVLIGASVVVALGAGEYAWIIGGVVLSGAVMVLLLAQAGAFSGPDERR